MTNEEIAREIGNAREIGDASITAIATGLLNLERLQENLRQMATESSTPDSTPTNEQERRKQFGARLRMIRTLRNISRNELAKKLGLSSPFIANIENGRREPSNKHLIGMAKVLNVTTDWLLDVPPPSP